MKWHRQCQNISIKHPKGCSKPLFGSVSGWVREFLQAADSRPKGVNHDVYTGPYVYFYWRL